MKDRNTSLFGGAFGYAVPKEWHQKYLRRKENLPSIDNASLVGPDGTLTEEAKYSVLSCTEWETAKKKCFWDIEVPVGVVEITIVLKRSSPVTKTFQALASQNVFEVIRMVLFAHSMTEEEFTKTHTYVITGNVNLSQQLIKCEAQKIFIEVESTETASRSPEDAAVKERRPAEFRNVGLSCYMNTALQVLLGVEELSQKVLSISNDTVRTLALQKDTSTGYSKEKCAQLFIAYRSLVKSAQKGEECGHRLREIKRVLGSIDGRYGKCSEEDAGEVFSLILNNFNYLFEHTEHEKLISSLFMYSADQTKVFLNREGCEVLRKHKNIYKSFVLNGSLGSEKGPHAHVIAVHRNQLVLTSLCVHLDPSSKDRRTLSVLLAKKKIAKAFGVSTACIVAGEVSSEGFVWKRDDAYVFPLQKNLCDQPVFYITDFPESDAEFVFLRYLPQKDTSSRFFTSFFGNSDQKHTLLPHVLKKTDDLSEFLSVHLGIQKRPCASDTALDVQEVSPDSVSCFRTRCAILSQKIWNADTYAGIINSRKPQLKDSLHVQCVLTHWENRSVRTHLTLEEKKEQKDSGAASAVEFSYFSQFSKYFCVQLPFGLGLSAKCERFFEKQKLHVEKDGLVLDGGSYSLVGILVHHNFGIGGHYVAFTKRGHTWYHCNDSTITQSSALEAAGTGYPYGILYKRQN
ncbi:hypothetical protein NECID01_0194 [Nematocida sp. AWRm77]|nr:hypothetical protein NECID01_0194 [Nematocida sp. AWRm77]